MQQFLTNLLPGLRDARAPLAAGYLWLLAAWLLFADDLPAKSEASDVFAAAYRLGDTFGALAAGLAISFAAYLIGAVSQTLTDYVLRRVEAYRRRDSLPLLDSWRRVGLSRSQVLLSPRGEDTATQYVYGKVGDGLTTLREANVDVRDFLEHNFDGVSRPLLEEDLIDQKLSHIEYMMSLVNWEDDYAWRPGSHPGHIPSVLDERRSRLDGQIDALLIELNEELSRNAGWKRDFATRSEEILEEMHARSRIEAIVKTGADTRVDLERLAEETVAQQLTEALIGQLHLVEARLMTENAELYGRFDRLKSESELRLAVSLPLASLTIILAWKVNWLFLAAILPIFLLALSGWIRGREAGETLLDALETTEGLVPPSVQRFQLLVDRATRKPSDAASGGPQTPP